MKPRPPRQSTIPNPMIRRGNVPDDLPANETSIHYGWTGIPKRQQHVFSYEYLYQVNSVNQYMMIISPNIVVCMSHSFSLLNSSILTSPWCPSQITSYNDRLNRFRLLLCTEESHQQVPFINSFTDFPNSKHSIWGLGMIGMDQNEKNIKFERPPRLWTFQGFHAMAPPQSFNWCFAA